ncbi:MAG: choice-of-anchor L domain-containing protein [Deltaproteobacteria bacterium]|nr:choice-of-anchor L domain-containing protein [Deltaproteobacteria bacterium]
MLSRYVSLAVPMVFALSVGACGPTSDRECVAGVTDLNTDPSNCGSCGNVCADGYSCVASGCIPGDCQPGTTEECYTGPDETLGVGPCVAGSRTCDPTATWSKCTDVYPVQEDCGNSVDDNCNGNVDDDVDADGDGFTSCSGNDCCDSTECTKPELVNSGSFDAAGNNFDDDCNGFIDDTILLCDQGIPSNTTNAMEFARAIDICQVAGETDTKWGVITATLTLADGTGTVDPEGHAVRPRFGTGAVPQGGVNLAILSTGGAAAKTDVMPGYHEWGGYSHVGTNESPFPADFLAANGGMLPNAPDCPAASGDTANDPTMLTLRVRVPTNAKSFKLSTMFYSAEFPEWTCSSFNDFFVVLLDSTYAGDPANPADKNLAFYQPAGTMDKVPVGVNLGHGNTGQFTQCVNGATGCIGEPGNISTCTGVEMLAGTGFDDAASGSCDTNSVEGGATGWLVTSGNVTPGEVITLRIAVWDTSDHILDSLAVVDGFQWSTEVAQPGTVIFSGKQPDRPVVQRDLIQNTLLAN